MKNFKRILSVTALAAAFTFIGASSVSAQETMMGKIGSGTKSIAKKTASRSKKVYKGGKRVGYTVGNKTWDGSKWVASNSWKGGKWVAVKTVNGTKWVYRKASGGTRRVVS